VVVGDVEDEAALPTATAGDPPLLVGVGDVEDEAALPTATAGDPSLLVGVGDVEDEAALPTATAEHDDEQGAHDDDEERDASASSKGRRFNDMIDSAVKIIMNTLRVERASTYKEGNIL
jgi:hypothetical protein